MWMGASGCGGCPTGAERRRERRAGQRVIFCARSLLGPAPGRGGTGGEGASACPFLPISSSLFFLPLPCLPNPSSGWGQRAVCPPFVWSSRKFPKGCYGVPGPSYRLPGLHTFLRASILLFRESATTFRAPEPRRLWIRASAAHHDKFCRPLEGKRVTLALGRT